MMLRNARVIATIPTKDLARAKAFYSQKLGFTAGEKAADGLLFECGDGSQFLLFPSGGVASGTHTQMAFEVDDVPSTVRDLKNRGVAFEEYNLPGFKTVESIAEVAGVKGAWFKDTDGNLISVAEPVRAGAAR